MAWVFIGGWLLITAGLLIVFDVALWRPEPDETTTSTSGVAYEPTDCGALVELGAHEGVGVLDEPGRHVEVAVRPRPRRHPSRR